jgi:hypothetical protein
MDSWLNDERNITDNLFNNNLSLEEDININNDDLSISIF